MTTPPSAFTTPTIVNVRQQVVERLIAASCTYQEGIFHGLITPKSSAERALDVIYKSDVVPGHEKQYFADIAFELDQYEQWERNGADVEVLAGIHARLMANFRKFEKDLLRERTPDELVSDKKQEKKKDLTILTAGPASSGTGSATSTQTTFLLPEDTDDDESIEADAETGTWCTVSSERPLIHNRQRKPKPLMTSPHARRK